MSFWVPLKLSCWKFCFSQKRHVKISHIWYPYLRISLGGRGGGGWARELTSETWITIGQQLCIRKWEEAWKGKVNVKMRGWQFFIFPHFIYYMQEELTLLYFLYWKGYWWTKLKRKAEVQCLEMFLSCRQGCQIFIDLLVEKYSRQNIHERRNVDNYQLYLAT